MKTCTSCGKSKPLEQFRKEARAPDGKTKRCAECLRAYARDYRRKNLQQAREANTRSYDKRRGTRAERQRQRGYRLKSNYNLTPVEYDAILTGQRGGCAICGKKPGKKRLHVDHDHACCPVAGKSCGKCVRGLLCTMCNHKLLGFICQEGTKGSAHAVEILERAIGYLSEGAKRTAEHRSGIGPLRS